MIFLQLAWSFFTIGLFSFGGGYAMIPMMQGVIAAQGWLPAREFADIVAISQMTPGPIAVNAATYIGYRVAGLMPARTEFTTGLSLNFCRKCVTSITSKNEGSDTPKVAAAEPQTPATL